MVCRPTQSVLAPTWLLVATLLCQIGVHSPARAEEPLHVRIDRLIEKGYQARKLKPAAVTDDAEFVRRVYLDLTGMIPTAEQTTAFLDDADPNKRSVLIDALLASPEYARQMQTYFDVMLMERQGSGNVPQDAWEKYLRESMAAGKPYNELIREIIAADGVEEDQRAAARFLLDRPAETDVLVRDVARLLLGRDMTCAQCHDHPVVDDYEQADYFGLYAYLNRTIVFADKKSKKNMLAEKAATEVTFKSVFIPEDTHQAAAHVLDGPPVEEPEFPEGEEYEVKPVKDNSVRPVPKFKMRARLAEDLTADSVAAFRRNIVNRMWAMMMGRGLVHPVDLHHSDNPASHPELLDLLASDFQKQGYDLRGLLRELALSTTYQRSSQLPAGAKADDVPEEAFAVAILKPLTPEQLAWSMMTSVSLVDEARSAQQAAAAKDKSIGKLAEDDPTRPVRVAEFVEAAVHQQLKGNLPPFQTLFGERGAPRPEFDANAMQALFLANGTSVHGWSKTAARTLVSAHGDDAAALAEELYLRVLSRRPDPSEVEPIAAQLADLEEAERHLLIGDLCWALLTSMEFRFNH